MSISGLPSRSRSGTLQSSRMKAAVSDARMPSLCSSRSSFRPGLERSTTNDLIAARPSFGSRLAQTTTRSARSPAVTKIFSPLSTYSSPSRTAVVLIAAESEPASGSVIAIAAHLPLNRAFCSSSATAAMAELPSPCLGIVSNRPTSPQHISMIESTEAMFEPLRFPPSPFRSAWLAPVAPAPLDAPPSSSPSISAASMSSSFGYSCSARSYFREIGRRTSSATVWACWTSGSNFLGTSRSIIRRGDPLPRRRRRGDRDTSARPGTP